MPTEQRHRLMQQYGLLDGLCTIKDGNGTEAWAPEKQIWVFWVIHKACSMVIHAA